ncbi:MAG: hypothetical protein QM533_09940 [Cytophagales bacterium]|nr:hypothetical protein [Cytophagales bacterium]
MRFRLLLTFAFLIVCAACSTDQMRAIGESRCLDLPTAQLGDRLDCKTRNKRVFDEFEKTQKKEPASSKGALKDDDSVCYKNPQAGEKPCATNP